ncbi:TatD family hydrolase [Candidatus Riflebacteria bacterium]
MDETRSEFFLLDSHCHLDDEKFAEDISEVVQRAKDSNVKILIQQSIDAESMQKSLLLTEKYESIYCTLGVHPHEAKTWEEQTASTIKNNIENPGVVAVGEIGLDYHYNFSPPAVQKEVFKKQLKIAEECGAACVLHVREAWDDLWNIMLPYEEKIKKRLLHCFTDGPEIAGKAVEHGYYIAFGGATTFKKMVALREAVKITPIDRLLLETDSPYMSPEPYRGRRNEPMRIPVIAKYLASLKGLEFSEFAAITSQNALDFFGISSNDGC